VAAPPAEREMQPPAGRSFDLATALERTAGDQELLKELAAVFCADCPQQMAALRRALDQGAARELKEAAHALKGAVGVFGVSAAFEAAFQLELLGQKGDLTGSELVYGRLREALRQLVPALEGLARGEGLEQSGVLK
jgi:HPt (histidine-containing phosphotransfer) domain-containing protein